MKVSMYQQGADTLEVQTHTIKSPEELISSLKIQLALAQAIWPTQLHGSKVATDLVHVISLNVQSELAVETQRLKNIIRRCKGGTTVVDLGNNESIALYQNDEPPWKQLNEQGPRDQ